MKCSARFLCLLFIEWIRAGASQNYDSHNEVQDNPKDKGSSSPACCDCDYSDLLTRFIEAIGSDELARRFEVRGLPGPEGPIGPEGLEGRLGKAGEMGPMGPPGERGYRGEMGRPGRPGQKGEPAEVVVHRQLPGQRVIVLKGEKGDDGKRGTKGERGMPGLTVVGQKGEAGTPAEFSYELKQSLRGEKGERGIPGRMLNCQNCYKARKKISEKGGQGSPGSEQVQKIYIPVQGPPGKDIVGSPGPKGEPGESGRVTKNHVVVLSYEEELSKVFDQHTFGTLAYVRVTETFFIQTERGWKEIMFTGRFIDPYANRRRHTRHKP